jgi:quercetin dioxygenase-like cupin family protein
MDLNRFPNVQKAIDMYPTLNAMEQTQKGRWHRFALDNGESENYILLNKPKVTVLDAYLACGSTFKWHYHRVCETIIVYQGEIKFEDSDGNEFVCTPENPVYFNSNTPHRVVETKGDTKAIAVLVPSEEGVFSVRK